MTGGARGPLAWSGANYRELCPIRPRARVAAPQSDARGVGSSKNAMLAMMAKRGVIVFSGNSADLINIEIIRAERRGNDMGILTQQQGAKYVISSDRSAADAPTNRPPRGKPFATYEVWTGATWSAAVADATMFDSLVAADLYVKENYSLLSGKREAVSRPARPARVPRVPIVAPAASLDPLPSPGPVAS